MNPWLRPEAILLYVSFALMIVTLIVIFAS